MSQLMPWIVVAPAGVHWLGHAKNEDHAWQIALGWPGEAEVQFYKQLGWYAVECTVSWHAPQKENQT